MLAPIIGVLPILGGLVLLVVAAVIYILLSKSPKVDKVIHNLTDDVDFLDTTSTELIQKKEDAIQNIQNRVTEDKSEIEKKTQDIKKMEGSLDEEKGKESANEGEVGE
ncbi:hypothetical protein LCGC14_0608570 [marine sediment metagenome]|uniref:Uncharacterized protein n=1 Tax=marine sediment metagenome TaxID=412755 RepID=A0A0F9RD83_9ZZZZ